MQIPIEALNNDFNISFYNYKNQQLGIIKTNLIDFINPEKKGQMFLPKEYQFQKH